MPLFFSTGVGEESFECFAVDGFNFDEFLRDCFEFGTIFGEDALWLLM